MFEDTKGRSSEVVNRRKTDNYNDQKFKDTKGRSSEVGNRRKTDNTITPKKDKRTNDYLQNTTQKNKRWRKTKGQVN